MLKREIFGRIKGVRRRGRDVLYERVGGILKVEGGNMKER